VTRTRRRVAALAVLVLSALPGVGLTPAQVARAEATLHRVHAVCPVATPPLVLVIGDLRGWDGFTAPLGVFDPDTPTTVYIDWRVPLARLIVVVAHEAVHACRWWAGGAWRDERGVQAEALRILRAR